MNGTTNGEDLTGRTVQVASLLDTKVGVVLAFVALSTVEILGYLLLAAAEKQGAEPFLSFVVSWSATGGVFLSLVATGFGLFAMKPRDWNLTEPNALQNVQNLKTKRWLVTICGALVFAAILSYSIAAVALLSQSRTHVPPLPEQHRPTRGARF